MCIRKVSLMHPDICHKYDTADIKLRACVHASSSVHIPTKTEDLSITYSVNQL